MSKQAGAGLSAEERAAIRERKKELAAQAAGADGEREVLAKIAEMPEADRKMAERLHALVKAAAPDMTARTWYGMPAYAKAGKTICFFQSAHRFKARYATFGFTDKATLDQGEIWPTSYALKSLGPKEEAAITALLKKAVGSPSAPLPYKPRRSPANDNAPAAAEAAVQARSRETKRPALSRRPSGG